MARPKTAAEARQFLNRRITRTPHNAVPNVTVEGTTATLRLYDPIDDWGEGWGMSAGELAQALDQIPANLTTIELLLNSPGGFVHEAYAMITELKRHPARVVAVVTGLAASAASFLACSVDELVMAPKSDLMIHDVWQLTVGDAALHRTVASDLDRLSDDVAGIYARKAGGTVAKWRDLMRVETWYSADQAVDVGLADRIDTTANQAATSSNRARSWQEQEDSDALELLDLRNPRP